MYVLDMTLNNVWGLWSTLSAAITFCFTLARFGFFNGISTSQGYLMSKPPLSKISDIIQPIVNKLEGV